MNKASTTHLRLLLAGAALAVACNGEVTDPGGDSGDSGASTGDGGDGASSDGGDDGGDSGATGDGDGGSGTDGSGTGDGGSGSGDDGGSDSGSGTDGGGSSDTGSDGGGGVDGSVACTGDTPADACDLASEICCAVGMDASCEAPASCNDTVFACDGPEDCTGGVCCFDLYAVEQGGSWCANDVGECGAAPPACHDQADCDTGTCMPALMFTPWWQTCQ